MSTISSGTTLTTALVQTGDTTGDLVIKTGSSNTTAMTISGTDQSVTLVGSLTANTNASTITTGTVPTARLATGTANSSTYLRGDQTWAAVPAAAPGGSTTQVQFNNAGAFGGDSGFVYSSNNVGIGNSSPNARLEVNKTITFSNIDDFAQLVVKSASGATGKLLNIGVDDTNNLSFIQSVNRGTNSNNLVLQRYGGNVGIGATSPTEPLTVQANSGGYALTLLGRSAGENAQWFAFANNAGTVQAGMYATSNNLIFATNSGYVERGRFDNSGNFLFNSGYGSVATAYGVRAWVNFNASSGTPTIRSSAGISSLTDNGTGDTTVNLSFTMPDINYSVSGICNWNITGNFGQFVNGPFNQAPTTSTFRILTPAYNGATYDCYQVTLQFVR